jgi:Fe2+ or Zn2+ uptake regulation protein
MNKGPKTYDIALERLNQYLKEQHMRVSKVREMVLEQICLLPQPFTADQLVQACTAERISTGTVYNTLALFVSIRILNAITRQRGKNATEYELITGSKVRMQVICQKCQRVTHFRDPALERLILNRKYTNFNLQYYSLFIYGECKYCRYKKRTTEE